MERQTVCKRDGHRADALYFKTAFPVVVQTNIGDTIYLSIRQVILHCFYRNSCNVSNVTCWRLQKNVKLSLSCYELNDSMNQFGMNCINRH